MNEPVPTAKQLEDVAFILTVALVGLLVCAIADAFDGVASLRRSTYRLVDDPTGFRGALVMKWGFPAILAVIGAIATGIGALVLKAAGKASDNQ